MERLGIIEGDKHPKKLTFKHTPLNKQIPNGIDHHISQHAMSL